MVPCVNYRKAHLQVGTAGARHGKGLWAGFPESGILDREEPKWPYPVALKSWAHLANKNIAHSVKSEFRIDSE